MRRKGFLSGILPGLAGDSAVAPDIDYPEAGEKVARGHYAIRVSGCQGECQVAIDDGEWQTGRCADGFCWHDWSPEQPGTHRISARIRAGNKWVKSQRTCRVV